MVHEVDQILTDCDDFGVVGKPLTSASQRHQNHQNPLSFDPFHDPFLISSQRQILKVFASPRFLTGQDEIEAAMMMIEHKTRGMGSQMAEHKIRGMDSGRIKNGT